MSLTTMSNFIKQKSSLGPTNGRQTVGDGASLNTDNKASVLAVCHIEGNDDMYYYSTTFSGGPGLHLISTYSGAFDAPKVKCPPDRGSSDCVTGSPASFFSTSNNSISSSPESIYHPKANYRPTNLPLHANIPTLPRLIPGARRARLHSGSDLSTPPLTPDDDDGSDFGSLGEITPAVHNQKKDALDFLMTIFPRQGLQVLPYAKSVTISAPNSSAAFEGVVLHLPGQPKTMYVDGKNAESLSLRESIVALLDLADDSLGCSALVIVLERTSPNLGALLHSLMYVGGTVVTKPPYQVNPGFVLVGLEM